MGVNHIKKRELLRFLVGGGSGVCVDYLSYKALMMAGLGRSISKGSSFILGSIVGFIINKYWTFESAFLREKFFDTLSSIAVRQLSIQRSIKPL